MARRREQERTERIRGEQIGGASDVTPGVTGDVPPGVTPDFPSLDDLYAAGVLLHLRPNPGERLPEYRERLRVRWLAFLAVVGDDKTASPP
jgi:hypothetical protein